jgi:hypothetical protein
MDTRKAASEAWQRIQELWNQLERTSPGTPEYDVLLTEIRALSVAYQTLTGTSNSVRSKGTGA